MITVRAAFYYPVMAGDMVPLQRAMEHLSAGAWADARASFDDALAEARSPEALFGLAVAAWWLGDTDAALVGWEHAYTASMERGDLERAVFSAVYLCLGYEMSLGNEAVATAWVDRVEELVATHDLTPFTGWVSLCRAHLANDHGRPGDAESWARESLDLAGRRAIGPSGPLRARCARARRAVLRPLCRLAVTDGGDSEARPRVAGIESQDRLAGSSCHAGGDLGFVDPVPQRRVPVGSAVRTIEPGGLARSERRRDARVRGRMCRQRATRLGVGVADRRRCRGGRLLDGVAPRDR
jgi:hypothetical protein